MDYLGAAAVSLNDGEARGIWRRICDLGVDAEDFPTRLLVIWSGERGESSERALQHHAAAVSLESA